MKILSFVSNLTTTLCLLTYASALEESSETPDANGELLQACMSDRGIDNVEAVQAALAKGADINTTGDRSGQTPFMAAVLRGKLNIVKYLHSVGADIAKGERNGYTPAHGAAFQGRVDVMAFLIDVGVDVTEVHEGDQYPPFMRTCWGKEERHAETLQLLVDRAGIDPTVVVNEKTCEESTDNPHVKRVLAEYKRGQEL